jgi:hypothetical protein
MPKKNTKKQLKKIAKKVIKPIPIMFRQKPMTTCCEGYKSGSAFTIPFGFADRLGTQRLPINQTVPQNITNIYNQHIPNAPVAPFKPKVRIPQYIPAENPIPQQGVKETLPLGMYRDETGHLHQGPIKNEQGQEYMPINVPLMAESVTIGEPFETVVYPRRRKFKPKKIQVEEVQIPAYP